MFDWKQETKEKYFQKADRMLKENNLECFKISRKDFTLVKDKGVKVFFEPFSKKNITVRQLTAVKRIEGVKILNDRYTRRKPGSEKQLAEHGYIFLPLDIEDM